MNIAEKFNECFKVNASGGEPIDSSPKGYVPFFDPTAYKQKAFSVNYYIDSFDVKRGFRAVIFIPLPSFGTSASIIKLWENQGGIQKCDVDLGCDICYSYKREYGDPFNMVVSYDPDTNIFFSFDFYQSNSDEFNIVVLKKACDCMKKALGK